MRSLLVHGPVTRRGILTRLGVALGTAPVALLVACTSAAPSAPTVAPGPAATAVPPAATQPAEAKTAAPAAAKGTVTVDWWVPNFHAPGAKPLKEKFEAEYPNIKLNQIETVSEGLLQKVLTTLKGSTQPDLIDVANGWNPILSQAGLVADLTDRKLDTSDWLPGPLATAQFEGKLFGVPFRSEAIALIWNKGLFQDAGLDPNKAPGSWEELVDTATKTNKPPDHYGFGLVAGEQNNTWFRVTTFIWANDGDVLSPDYKEAICNQPACVEAVQFYADLATKYKVAPEIALTANTEQMDQLFTAGKLALHITGQYIRPRIADTAPNLKWGARPTLPRKKIAGPLGGWNYVIPKGAKNPNEAWTLIQFIIRPENLAALNNANGVFPSRKSALQNDMFKVPELAPFAEQLQYARAAPAIQQWGDVQKAFVTGLQSIIAGQASAQGAMDTAAADINKLLKKA